MAEPGFMFLPMVLTHSRNPDDALPTAENVAAKVALTLEPHGGLLHRWEIDGPNRTRAAVVDRLTAWAKSPPRNTVLLWMGHGQTSGAEPWLSTADSDSPTSGIKPGDIADILSDQWLRRSADHHDEWVMLVIEACAAPAFIKRLWSILENRVNGPKRVMMIGIGGDELDGVSLLGTFKDGLDEALTLFEDNFGDIQVSDVWDQLTRRLGGESKLVGRLNFAAPWRVAHPGEQPIITPLDNYAEIRDFIQELPEQERYHFLSKAQGAETGEELWYFTGRKAEREKISQWLRDEKDGMFVVTGGPGSGKSAFLGNLLVYTKPLLRKMLIEHSFLDYVPAEELPPDDPFHAVIHVSGLDFDGVVAAIAGKAGVTILSDGGTPVDQLLRGIAARPTPFRLLVDALDEAQQPLEIAALLLRQMGAMPRVSIIVGTRASTTEGIDREAPHENDILQALGANNGSTDPTTIRETIRPEQDAIRQYARRRLKKAVDRGLRMDEQDVEQFAELISRDRKRQFIYARLAVHEILARHRIDMETGDELTRLLGGDHRDLFKAAVERLSKRSAAYLPLLQALAITRGRGIPEVGDVWLSMARALSRVTHEEPPDIDYMEIQNLRKEAAPYIMVDSEYGQQVYRLAHRTFQEHFEAQWS